jgi:dihydroorotate dehydrogenase electron transfer subunit
MIRCDIPKAIPIKKIINETPHVKTFVFEHELKSQPGQFVNLWIPRVDEKPMSIAYDGGKEFWVTMFAVGPFSKLMHTLKVGDLVGVRGPYGKPFGFKKGQRLVMMAGGYGAAPLYNLTLKAIKQGCKVDFVVGARGKEHLLYLNRVKKLKNVKLHVATDDGSVGKKGYNTLILDELLKGKKRIDCVYACGPEMMMKKISDMCAGAKVEAQLSIERYMKCGFGVCGQCCVDPKGQRMCMEGPVVHNALARKIVEFGKYHRDKTGKMHQF